jgi:hypothetical protein
MDNPQKLATLGAQDTNDIGHRTHYNDKQQNTNHNTEK